MITSMLNARPWLIAEPLVLLIALGVAAQAVTPMLGVAPDAAAAALAAEPPAWRDLARLEGLSMAVKWAFLLAAAWLLARARGYRLGAPLAPPTDHPAGRPNRSLAPGFGDKLLLGLALGAPLSLVALLPRWRHYEVAPIGEVPAIWDVIYAAQWTPDFWLFMAVSSFVIPPIVEEVFFRGYLLGALATAFSPLWACLISAALFAMAHLQYVSADPFALYNLGSVFFGASVLAASVYWTRSLSPAIVAHAYGNVPRPTDWTPMEAWLLIPAAAILIYLVVKAARRA